MIGEYNIKISPKEQEYAEKYIRRLEKDSRQWPLTRWMMLISSFIFFGLSIYFFNIFTSFADTTSSIFSIQQEFNPKNVEQFIEGQLISQQFKLLGYIKSFLVLGLGGAYLFQSLINWNRHIKSGLTAKALRKLISEESKKENEAD